MDEENGYFSDERTMHNYSIEAEMGFERIADTLGDLIGVYMKEYEGTLPSTITLSDKMYYSLQREYFGYNSNAGTNVDLLSPTFRGIQLVIDGSIAKNSVTLEKAVFMGTFSYNV